MQRVRVGKFPIYLNFHPAAGVTVDIDIPVGEMIEGIKLTNDIAREISANLKDMYWEFTVGGLRIPSDIIERSLPIAEKNLDEYFHFKARQITDFVLMGSENPEGWKLEELLAKLRQELVHKTNKIINDNTPQAKMIVENNLKIIEHLGAAEALQRASYGILDAMGPNEGPKGKPRIGKERP